LAAYSVVNEVGAKCLFLSSDFTEQNVINYGKTPLYEIPQCIEVVCS